MSLLEALAGGEMVNAPVAMVVAHPDDEMIAAAGSLVRLRSLTLIHVTDGALEGDRMREVHARVRREELTAALLAALAVPERRICYGVADQTVRRELARHVVRLAGDLMAVDAVLTHAYEGGHTDHDAVAEMVWDACALLMKLTGRAPARLEFASYFRLGGDVRTGEFWPDATCPAYRVRLSPSALRRREAALACYGSQRDNLRYFSTRDEVFRAAPVYDFKQIPPPLREQNALPFS